MQRNRGGINAEIDGGIASAQSDPINSMEPPMTPCPQMHEAAQPPVRVRALRVSENGAPIGETEGDAKM